MKKSHSTKRSSRPIVNKNIDALVDDFVAKVNAGYRESVNIHVYETSPSVLVGEPDDFGFSDWMIEPYDNIDWVDPLEQRLGSRFPITYRSLITRYIFPGFEIKDIFFFSNTPEGKDYFELRNRIFCDPGLYETLLPRGYIQFGKDESDYDPICFDTNNKANDDCPIVQIDHEYAFDGVIEIVRQIAPSFGEFIVTFIGEE